MVFHSQCIFVTPTSTSFWFNTYYYPVCFIRYFSLDKPAAPLHLTWLQKPASFTSNALHIWPLAPAVLVAALPARSPFFGGIRVWRVWGGGLQHTSQKKISKFQKVRGIFPNSTGKTSPLTSTADVSWLRPLIVFQFAFYSGKTSSTEVSVLLLSS